MPTTNSRGTPLFMQQLHRASAQRGRLDPLYQDLSDRFTTILQRLYPVWALLGPGLSDPGHIEIHSRTIYLDSDELLGTREQLEQHPPARRQTLTCFGVALHETFHGKHTKRWTLEHDLQLTESGDPALRQLAEDRRLLEEPRMEAHGVRDHPHDSVRGRFIHRALAAAVIDVIVPRFQQQADLAMLAGRPLTRDMAARASVYLKARSHYGIVDENVLATLEPLWLAVLGKADLQALDDLYAQVIWIPDGELERLSDAAREYRRIVGEPDPSVGDTGDSDTEVTTGGQGTSAGSPSDSDAPGRGHGGPGSLSDALNQALNTARESQLKQLNEEFDLKALLDNATGRNEPTAPVLGRGRGTGRPTGRMPSRGVNRPPAADEVRWARRYATQLRRARVHGARQIDKRTPGGRFDGRAYTRAQAQRATGRPPSSHPWRIVREVKAPIQAPHVALVIDTSGSMAEYEYALGPIAWILSEGLRQIDGRLAVALFGNGVSLLSDGREPLPLVPGIKTGGGTAFAADALTLATDQLDLHNRRRPRFAYCISDGGWADTQTGVEKIRALAEHGVPTVHIAIGAEPLSVECDRIVVIDDPAQALDQIATETSAALRAAASPQRVH